MRGIIHWGKLVDPPPCVLEGYRLYLVVFAHKYLGGVNVGQKCFPLFTIRPVHQFYNSCQLRLGTFRPDAIITFRPKEYY